MRKFGIGDIILALVIILILANTAVAYISYRQVSDNKEPSIYLNKTESEEKIVYSEFLYNVIVKENSKERVVSLKLFFLK